MTNPTTILRAAIKSVPPVKWALGVAGVISAIALVKGFFVDIAAALLAGFGMLVLMTLLVLFASAAKARTHLLVVPALVFSWSILMLVIACAALGVSSTFFRWPRPLPELLKTAGAPATTESSLGQPTPTKQAEPHEQAVFIRSAVVPVVLYLDGAPTVTLTAQSSSTTVTALPGTHTLSLRSQSFRYDVPVTLRSGDPPRLILVDKDQNSKTHEGLRQ